MYSTQFLSQWCLCLFGSNSWQTIETMFKKFTRHKHSVLTIYYTYLTVERIVLFSLLFKLNVQCIPIRWKYTKILLHRNDFILFRVKRTCPQWSKHFRNSETLPRPPVFHLLFICTWRGLYCFKLIVMGFRFTTQEKFNTANRL